jgi:hypothetical protein
MRMLLGSMAGRENYTGAPPARRERGGSKALQPSSMKRRTESSGNICSNWGYLAEERKTDCVNQRGVGVRRDRIWLVKQDSKSQPFG